MDYIVLKNNNNVKYTIFEFKRMSSSERDSLKGIICCPSCKGDAGYRKESSDGKVACFFAKHKETCALATSNKSDNKKGQEEVNIIEVDTSVFGIRWNYKADKKKLSDLSDGGGDNQIATNMKNYVKNPPKTKQAKLSLAQILTYAEIDKLSEVEIDISINEVTKDLSEVVYKVSQIDDTFVGKKAFFWGEMKYFKTNFINLRDSKNVSVYIVDNILENFNNRYKSKFFDVVKSNSMIIFGKIIKDRNDNFLIVLDDNNKFYFRKK